MTTKTKTTPGSETVPEAGDLDELDQVAAAVSDELKPPPATPEAPEPSAADELVDLAEEKVDSLLKPGEFERLVAQLTEDDLADVIELGFGYVADSRGPHWEIKQKQSRRLAKWLKKALTRHPQLLAWLGEWLPDLVCALLFTYEIWSRYRIDQELAKEKKGGAHDGGHAAGAADAQTS